eukprot:GHVS01020809.1.p1 GENE.GHVS01020809.1~~GHVS01020809.1.p1  ORF type:complete len:595 (+),score=60.60 GHVS01020809.1:118-1902(+)
MTFLRRLHHNGDHKHSVPTVPYAELAGNKVGAAVVMLAVASFGCFLPFWCHRKFERSDKGSRKQCILGVIMQVINAFAGGAFLGLALFHLLPEALEEMELARLFLTVNGQSTDLGCYILSFLGFSLMLLLEHILYDTHGELSHTHCAGPSHDETICEDGVKQLLTMGTTEEEQEPVDDDTIACMECALDQRSMPLETHTTMDTCDASSGGTITLVCKHGHLGSRSRSQVQDVVWNEHNWKEDESSGDVGVCVWESLPSRCHDVASPRSGCSVMKGGAAFNGCSRSISFPCSNERLHGPNGRQHRARCGGVKGNPMSPGNVLDGREWFAGMPSTGVQGKKDAECGGCGCSPGRTKQFGPIYECCGCDSHCDHSHDTTAVLRNPNNNGHACGGTHAKSDDTSAGGSVNAMCHHPIQREKVGGVCSAEANEEHKNHKLTSTLGRLASPAFFVSLALATHSVFEGIVVGTACTILDVWLTTVVIVGHKGAAGFALSVVFVRQQLCRWHCGLFLGIFLLASPVGVFIGMLAAAGGNAVAGVLTSLCIGTVLYIANEVITAELTSGGPALIRWLKFGGFLFGGCLVFCLTLLHFAVGHEG